MPALRTRGRGRSTVGAIALAVAALAVTACQPTPIPTRPGTERVVVFGDSIPSWLLRDGSGRGVDTTRFTLVDGTLGACEPAIPYWEARASTGKLVPVPAACRTGWRKLYPPHLTVAADVAILMPGTHAMLDHQIDGVWAHPCHAAARTWFRDDITARLRYLQANAGRAVLVLPPWPEPLSRWIMPADMVKRADCVRREMRAAATARGVATVDLGTYLCPTAPTTCKPYRTQDGMHIDPAKAPTVLKWLLTTVGDL